ncbi:hypothetical protein FOL47_000263 [Perkinsus chesapeaki]|uniref:Peptidase A1 domain-containing protein n=1 Tax=Perkinsus chesapeaki TaxID=330153 RepID=A0A7J6KYH2_PERCH|nr:hypothetical protein FOL47_000263 [Perkinsus chesapeaki]
MTNYGNIDFAMNWIKSLRRVRMAKWYMFATDDRTLEELQRRVGPQDTHKVYRLPTSIHSELENNKGEHYKYRSEGWTKLMQSVPRFIKWLLFEKIRGPILYSDTDIVWIEHPYSAFPANPDKTKKVIRFDLIASVDGRVFEDNPRECPQYGSFCGGLMHLQNNIKIEKLLDDWLSHIMKMADGKNQPAYNVAISENRRHAGLVVHTLDCAAYVNGWRAFCLDIVSKKKKFTCQFDWSGYQNRSPVMLHATYTFVVACDYTPMHLFSALSILAAVLKEANAGGILRQEIERSLLKSKEPPGFALYTAVAVDKQEENVFVDTGSSYFSLILKSYYESMVGKGSCEELFFKCYECPQPCEPTEPTYIKFGGGYMFEIFKHEGSITIGTATVDGISFGLIFGSDPPPPAVSPVQLLGLGPDVDQRYPSLMKQLLAHPSKPIKENTFALYLKPVSSDTSEGELILGGGDDSLYQKPLLFVPAIKEDSWTVKLNAIQPEKGPKVAVDDSVLLDTGCNSIFTPQAVFGQLIASIAQAASTGAGKEVEIQYDKDTGVWTVACEYRSFMPNLHFMLSGLGGNVPLSISHETYVPETHGYCYLLVTINPLDTWQLPELMLIGNYLEFQFNQKRVGIAKLK